jgi:hypothetical protein
MVFPSKLYDLLLLGIFLTFICENPHWWTFCHCCIYILILKREEATVIEMNEPVAVTFALRYMNSLTKATHMSNIVTISLSNEILVVGVQDC